MFSKESIFISYRRADTEGFAGRLADSLTIYFGEGRVFRDVGSINPGENFEEILQSTVMQAEVVIVLIGPNWLASEGEKLPRLHDKNDHLAAEIASALEQKRLVIPVLVQNAKMPLESELPDKLRNFSRCNAISLSDESWSSDLVRLARVLALDISGSVKERRLYWVQRVVLLCLSVPLIFGLSRLGWDLEIRSFHDGIVMIPMFIAGFVLASSARWIEPSRRKWIWLSVITVIVGAIVIFWQYQTGEFSETNRPFEAQKAMARLCMTITIIFTLVSLSGFKASDRVD